MDENEEVNYEDIFSKVREELLDDDCLADLKNIFVHRMIKKDMYFLHEGDKSTEMGFVKKGLFRSYYLDNHGNDITKYFYPEESMLFSYLAHLTRKESEYSIQALEDSEILVAKIHDFEKMAEENYKLLLFYKKMIDYTLVLKEEHALGFKRLTSVERYRQFLTRYPGLEKRIKQYQLASFLGITAVSLSRMKTRLKLNK